MAEIVRIEGFREFEAALAKLPQAMGRSVLRKVARGALEPMADAAQGKAPVAAVDGGQLRASIAVSERRTRRVRRGGRFDKATGLEMAMGPSSGEGVLSYATHVEFGTVDTAPQPYMRPAWDGGAGKALEYVKDHLWDELAAAAQRVAKRGARLLRRGL